MPPVFVLMLGALGAFAAARWLTNEARRINAALYPEQPEFRGEEPAATLRRDPVSGVYRPE
jgi:hypothetical protein